MMDCKLIFKIAVLTFKALHGSAPDLITELKTLNT